MHEPHHPHVNCVHTRGGPPGCHNNSNPLLLQLVHHRLGVPGTGRLALQPIALALALALALVRGLWLLAPVPLRVRRQRRSWTLMLR